MRPLVVSALLPLKGISEIFPIRGYSMQKRNTTIHNTIIQIKTKTLKQKVTKKCKHKRHISHHSSKQQNNDSLIIRKGLEKEANMVSADRPIR